MNERLTDSRLANLAASAIFRTFDTYQQEYKALTRQAKQRFEQQDWHGIQADMAGRLELYPRQINAVVAEIKTILEERDTSTIVWASMKAVYSGLIAQRDDWELAETFFNSVTRRIFTTVGVNPQLEFIATDFETPLTCASEPIFRTYQRLPTSIALIEKILRDYAFAMPYRDLERDVQRVAMLMEAHLYALGASPRFERLEVLRPIFYRNKGAYIIGRIIHGQQTIPFVLALLSNPTGVYVDAVLLEEHEVSILFSFTRSHFLVDVDRPYDLVQFLTTIMPSKRIAELYIAIGHHKHGKTELYRDLLQHLATSDDRFEIAVGERGMVMIVFTLPSYDVVFKLIKDRFAPPKDTTRRGVIQKYQLVFRHDRAGRLVEAYEFEYLKLERARFSPELLAELEAVAASTVSVEGQHVVIKHLYVERRVLPLDVHLRQAPQAAAEAATLDFGNAIKDLAISNIFPGDMLLKNFGVTRNGRVVFYDYDEIDLLTDCNFMHMPEPQSYDEDMASEPWFAVGPHDVFPEEFKHFLGLRADLRRIFDEHHGELLTVDYWRDIQARLNAGEVIDIFPYDQRRRLGVLF